ncbi:hypothetical protein MHYP_G00253250 [Metynnis hypsauchen]
MAGDVCGSSERPAGTEDGSHSTMTVVPARRSGGSGPRTGPLFTGQTGLVLAVGLEMFRTADCGLPEVPTARAALISQHRL